MTTVAMHRIYCCLKFWRFSKKLRLVWLVVFILTSLLSTFAFCEDLTPLRLGILAKRGVEKAQEKWGPTAEYLSQTLHRPLVLVPLSFSELNKAVENRNIDFLFANPAIYVELEMRYAATHLVTLRNEFKNRSVTEFGGVLFCRADRKDINNLEDLRGKSFMAVDFWSFGGFLAARRELRRQGINPFQDFSSLGMAGTHDAVVFAVRDGSVDAGTVRSDVLERMAEEGTIRLDEFRVLNRQPSSKIPFLLSTPSYPEWPLAKLPHVPEELGRKVSVALLEMKSDSLPARAAQIAGWTNPPDYHQVHECLKELAIGPYTDWETIPPQALVKQYWPWLILVAAFISFGLLTSFYFYRLNRALKQSRKDLLDAQEKLEHRVAQRTEDLQRANDSLRQEIIERKRSEKELREERQRLELITHNIGVGVTIISPDYKVLMANRVLREIFGEIEGQYCYRIFNKNDNICPGCGVREVFEQGKELAIHEQVGVDADGKRIWSQIIATPLKDEQGHTTGAIEVVVPITARKETENRLKKALEDAEDGRDKIDNIIRSVADGLLVFSSDQTLILMNSRAEEMLGCEATKFNGKSLDFILQRCKAPPLFADLLRAPPLDQECEFEVQHLDHPAKSLRARSTVMRNQRGEQTGRVIVLQDITRERELDRMKTEFISTAAHELRTPLATIMGFADLLLNQEIMSGFSPEQGREFLQEILAKSELLTRIVEELLDISRIEAGQPMLMRKAPMDLGQILRRSMEHYRTFSTGHQFEVILAPNLPAQINADANKLGQVLENLLSNAVKYSPKGGLIRLKAARQDDEVEICVADQGIGMTSEQLDHIFDKFYRADSSNTAVSGLGLGMSIARKIVTDHGGDIWVKSAPNQGTEVFIRLPIN